MMLLTMVACNYTIDLGDKGEPDTGRETDTDSGGTDIEVLDPAETFCSNVAGIAGLGTTWDYDGIGDSSALTRVSTVTAIDADSVEITTVQRPGNDGEDSVRAQVWSYGCDSEGMWAETWQWYEAIEETAPPEFSYTIVFEPPTMWLPRTVEVGSTWEYRLQGTETNDLTGETWAVDPGVMEFNVPSTTSLALPMGTTTAFVVSSQVRDYAPYFDYRVEGLGLVADDWWRLESYTP